MLNTEDMMDIPECDAWTLQQDSIVSRHLLVEVWQQRDVDVAQTSSLTKTMVDLLERYKAPSTPHTCTTCWVMIKSLPCVECWSTPSGWSGSPRTRPPPHSWRRGTRWPCRWRKWSPLDKRRCCKHTRDTWTRKMVTKQPQFTCRGLKDFHSPSILSRAT